MLTKLEEFCGLVDMVILKQGNFHFIMKSIINIFSNINEIVLKKGKLEKI